MFFPRLPRRALRLALLVLVLPSFGSAAVVPAVVLDANGNLVLRWTGEIGEHYRVETSSDLVTWTQLPGEYSGAAMAFAPVVVAAGQPATAKRFWRVVTANRAFFRLTYSTTPEIVAGVAMPPVVASLVFADPRAPVSYGITAGTLPPGLVLDPATGAIHGVPAQTGVSSFTVTATNGALVASAVFKWWVQPDPDGTAIFRDATPLSTLLPPGRPPWSSRWRQRRPPTVATLWALISVMRQCNRSRAGRAPRPMA
ncbi:MAG: putative Ig domain-containing protein [Opitutaceae bacterium]|nr:putative Ig domain-containing protein [Opitutaceae bacterium]